MRHVTMCRRPPSGRRWWASLLVALIAGPAAATPYVWVGATGSWSDPSNWSPSGVPDAGDAVSIPAGTALLGSTRTIDSLRLASVLGGNGALTTGSLAFDGGSLGSETGSRGGSVTVTGRATLDGAAALTVHASHDLVLRGPTTWTAGNGSISAYEGGTMTIAAGAHYADLGAATASGARALAGSDTGGRFVNDGLYTRDGLGTTALIRFSNAGTFVLRAGAVDTDRTFRNAGTLRLEGGTFVMKGESGGTVSIAPGATLELASVGVPFDAWLGGTVTSAGTVRTGAGVSTLAGVLDGGTLELPKGTLVIEAGATVTPERLHLHGGVLAGPGTLVARTLTLQGGTFGAPAGLAGGGLGTTVVLGDARIDGTTSQLLDYDATLRLQGVTTWTPGGGSIASDRGGSVRIAAGALFIDQGAGSATGAHGWSVARDGSRSSNDGTYIRQGLGRTVFDGYDNNGLLRIDEGGITTRRFLNNAGELRIAPGAIVEYTDGNVTLDGTVTGGGVLRGKGGSGLITVTGVVDPGLPGTYDTLDVQGALAMRDGTELRIDLASALLHDALAVTGLYTPDGTLSLWGGDDLALHVGDLLTLATFDALTAGAAFDAIAWHGLPGYRFEVLWSTGALTLRVAEAPTPGLPEPPAWLLVLLAAGAAARAGRAARQRKAPAG